MKYYAKTLDAAAALALYEAGDKSIRMLPDLRWPRPDPENRYPRSISQDCSVETYEIFPDHDAS